ncbi:hypothetical protein H072_10681 [Dactylellina haptotyla CBS 200.50]|uniref:F-box domain-containing protein n=1 Tax=Dactylellina haptotyla (strain CBS 200.50) TaxID=1284197 RepID=S7ZZK5_DACHA|nr:hypothetical protein H072_10681 [Dactylellina haptotyla CBS 200.50]
MSYKDIIGLAPTDLQIAILSYVTDPVHLIRCTRVSKTWQNILYSSSLEPVYHRIIRRTWPYFGRERQLRLAAADHESYKLKSDREILITLGRNDAGIRDGHLHEDGFLVAPTSLGRTGYSYADGFLAVFSVDEDLDAERDCIYVYDISLILESGAELECRKVRCEGAVKHVSVANGYMAWMAHKSEDTTKIIVGLQDLIGCNRRTFEATILDIDNQSFALTISQEGVDAFADEAKGRSASALWLRQSPEIFCTNGRYICFSASFLTHYIVWDIRTATGKSYTLAPEWVRFLSDMWSEDPGYKNHAHLSYYLSMDDRGEIYSVINGFLEEMDCVFNYDRFILRYARKRDGKAIYMKDGVMVPPPRNAELNDNTYQPCVAEELISFPGGGRHNLFAYTPADMNLEKGFYDDDPFSTILTSSEFDLWIPRIVIDRKQPKRDPSWDPRYPDDGVHDTEFEYKVRYFNKNKTHILPEEMRGSTTVRNRIVPKPLSPDCIIWQCQWTDETNTTEEETTKRVRDVKIVGLKPVSYLEYDADIDYDNASDRPNFPTGHHLELQAPEPTSVCSLTVDYSEDQAFGWTGDTQHIVLSHYRTRKVTSGQKNMQLDFESVFRLFRYGSAREVRGGSQVAYSVRYVDDQM